MEIVHERIFASISAGRDIYDMRSQVFSASGLRQAGPATHIQGRPWWGEGLAGICIQAVHTGQGQGTAAVRQIRDGAGRPIGYGWRRGGADYLMLQNVHGLDRPGEARRVQTGRMFDNATEILEANGATYRNVVRTWIYLSDILSWYDEFNAVRNERYQCLGIMPTVGDHGPGGPISLPASTGIKGDNPMAAACVMDVLAIVGSDERRPIVEQLTNDRQEDAFLYGSAFSRAAYIGEPDVASILVSGIAAIDEKGRSRHIGDLRAQIQFTLDNLEALAGQKGASLADICQACVFLNRPDEKSVQLFRELIAQRGAVNVPAVCMEADVCRDDLLFEMDGLLAFGGRSVDGPGEDEQVRSA